MFDRRNVVALCAAFVLGACAGPAPTKSVLAPDTSAALQISEVTVDVSKMGPRTKGRALPAANVDFAVKQAANALLRGQGNGPRKARAIIEIENVSIITAGQSILIGGESLMVGNVTVVDARTGAGITPAMAISSGGGGWVAGGLIAAATQEDPNTEVRQMSLEFVSRARTLVFGNGPVPGATVASSAPVAAAAPASAQDDAERAAEAQRRAELARCRKAITNRCQNNPDYEPQ